MHILYQHGPEPFPPESDEFPAPNLLVEWSSWPRVFFGNLRDLTLSRPRPAPATDTAPGTFWPDVFVNRRMPLAPFRQSAVCHLFAAVAIWGLSHPLLHRPQIKPLNPFQHSKIVYYPVSPYLPPLQDESESEPAKIEKKGQPVYARQRIRSVPRRPDNTRQTIVTPSPLTIHKDVPLPNIVAWTRTEAPAPLAAATSMRTALTAPLINPIPPPPQIARTQTTAPTLSPPVAIAPPPATNAARNVPALQMPAPVPPAPSLQNRRLGDMNIAHMTPTVAAPRLAVVEQSTVPVRNVGTRRASAADNASAPSPPSPLAGMGTGGTDKLGRLIALGTHPAPAGATILAPQGNRRGIFATSPDGKADAPGTPDMHGGGMNGGSGGSSANGVRSPVPGLTVESGRTEMAAIRPPARAPSRDIFRQALTRASDIPRRVPPSTGPQPKVEDLGAGPKRYYSMTLNMPNLTSAGGSWIVRFAELKETQDQSPLTAPVATLKVDPAYPADLLRHGIEGVVTLYAVIRADGAVSAVRVLHGVDAQLDASARAALQRWHFRPGRKNGNAVDLEAVVQIPFVARRAF